MKSIVFLDIDGTLSQFEKIPESALQAIQIARKNGHKIFIDTGRVRSEMRDFMNLDIDGFCLSSGTEIWINKKRIFFHPLGADVAHQIQDHMMDLMIGYTMEGSRISYTDNISRRIFKKLYTDDARQILSKHRALFPSVIDMHPEDYKQIMQIQINYFGILRPEIIMDTLPEHLTWTAYNKIGGNITDSRFSKGTAIQQVLDYYGQEYRTISAGDADNDMPMLSVTDESIAMGNSMESIKDKVTYVTDDVRNDGLFNAFDHFGLL